MDKRTFLRIGLAGAAGSLFVPRELMAGMVEPALKTRLEGGVYHTENAFGRWNQALADHHLPTLGMSGGELQVSTNHPMPGYEHYIVKHQLLNADFGFMDEQLYDPTMDKKPETTFGVSGYHGVIYALTVCNVHDMWVNAIEV